MQLLLIIILKFHANEVKGLDYVMIACSVYCVTDPCLSITVSIDVTISVAEEFLLLSDNHHVSFKRK